MEHMWRKRRSLRWVVLGGALMLLAGACGGDADEGAAPGGTDGAVEGEGPANGTVEDDGAVGGEVAFEELATRCEELTDIATALRGEPPVEVDTDFPPEPSRVVGQATYETTECRYLYQEGDLGDAVTLGVARGEDGGALSPEARASLFDMLAADAEVDGLGDDAVYVGQGVMTAGASVHVVEGEAVYRVAVSVPDEMADAPFLTQEPLVEAARAFLDRVTA